MTRHKENDINRSPNGDDHARQFRPLKKWPLWIGMGGRFPSESLAVFIGLRIVEFIEKIDRGGFGRVDKVRLENGQFAARKTFDPLFANLSEDDRSKQKRRFIREVRIQSSFVSDSFFPVIRSDLSGDNPWFAMPIAERNLVREIEDFRANGEAPQVALADILNALEELHDLGYVHRDLKPQNVLHLNGRWRLTDFGLTLPPSGTTTRLTSYDSSWGTPMYCAPEQTTEFRNATAAVDIYAFGCILHDIFANAPRVPYQQQSADGQIGMIIEKCTHPRPDRRFKSVRALRGALLTHLAAGPSVSGSQSANEWVDALRESQNWSEARLGEFAAYLRRAQGAEDLHPIFSEIDEDILSRFRELDADLWKTVALAYCDWVQLTHRSCLHIVMS